jgi:hypothetical protein
MVFPQAVDFFNTPARRTFLNSLVGAGQSVVTCPHDESFPVTPHFTFRDVADCPCKRRNSAYTARLPVRADASYCSREHRNSNDTARLPVQAGVSDCSKSGE